MCTRSSAPSATTTARLLTVLRPRDSARRESVMHFELDRRLDDEELDELEQRILKVLADVRRVVADYPAMSQRIGTMVEHARTGAGTYPFDEVNETIAFLRWLLEGNFTFLGYREYEAADGVLRVVPGTGLGLLADSVHERGRRGPPGRDLRPAIQDRIDHGDLLVVDQDQPLLTRSPPRAHGLRRRPLARRDGRVQGSAGWSACSRPRPTPRRPPTRRCCTTSCAGSSRPRT